MAQSQLWVPPSARNATSFRKAPPPKMGEAFGHWAGTDTQYLQLPGGGILQFDLSKLTLQDYRSMRDHYQINASLSVLSFMMHRLDWKITGPDQAIRSKIEANMQDMWTRLIRAMSQAYWCGFAPTVIQWENDVDDRQIIATKFKDLVPENCEVNWKQVEGWAPPGELKPKYKIYDGIKQRGLRHPIPVENCVHPDTPILCADLVWRPAGTLNVGQTIIAFDEDAGSRGRKFRQATIVVNNRGVKPSVRISTDIGDPIEASVDHPFLVRRMLATSKLGWTWADARDLRPGDLIAHLGKPDAWEYDDSREAGWIAGMFDGEGCISTNGLSISQNNGVVLDHLKQMLAEKGFEFYANANTRDNCVQLTLRGGVRETARFLAVFRPHRLCANFPVLFEGVAIKGNKSVDLATVVSVDDVGDQPIASIQTSCGTFVTGGYLSHNTLWYPLLMENGDHYGKKLLRPAFPSWFFSILIHLFVNRYFERFGEPLPVGRADYESDVVVDGVTMNGRDAMGVLLEAIRSRSVAVLPSDRDPDTKEYDFNIEYLESQMRGADFERYLSRLDEEMSIGLFTPILLLRTAEVGSYNLGVGHMQMYMWMLNALAGDLAEYVNKYYVHRFVALNASPKVAHLYKWVPRAMGNESVETVRAILQELVRAGKAKPDLDELGQMAGLSLTEVKELTDPNVDPEADPEADPKQEDDRVGRPERNGGGGRRKPRGVGEPRATGKQIAARLQGQVEKAYRDGNFGRGFQPSLGFRRRFEESLKAEGADSGTAYLMTNQLFTKMEMWLDNLIPLGTDEFPHPDDFMKLFQKMLDTEIEDSIL